MSDTFHGKQGAPGDFVERRFEGSASLVPPQSVRPPPVDFKVNSWHASPMDSSLPEALEQLALAAAGRGLTRTQWAERAGIRKETLSRIFSRSDCDLSTLVRLATSAGYRLDFVPQPERVVPHPWDREAEAGYLRLCASRSMDARRWRKAGPAWFMAGLATLCANAGERDRADYLALARALCPAMAQPAEFSRWLEMSPAKPSRFLPMLRAKAGAPA